MFLLFFNICVKQLSIFERTVIGASDFKNCTMVHCDNGGSKGLDQYLTHYTPNGQGE